MSFVRLWVLCSFLSFLTFHSATLTNCNTTSLLTPVLLEAVPTIPVVQENVTFTVRLSKAYSGPTLTRTESWYNDWLSYNETWTTDPLILQQLMWTTAFPWPTRFAGHFLTRIRVYRDDETYLCVLHNVTIPFW